MLLVPTPFHFLMSSINWLAILSSAETVGGQRFGPYMNALYPAYREPCCFPGGVLAWVT